MFPFFSIQVKAEKYLLIELLSPSEPPEKFVEAKDDEYWAKDDEYWYVAYNPYHLQLTLYGVTIQHFTSPPGQTYTIP